MLIFLTLCNSQFLCEIDDFLRLFNVEIVFVWCCFRFFDVVKMPLTCKTDIFSGCYLARYNIMPKGARLMIQRTIWDTASAVLAIKVLVLSEPMPFMAMPNMQAQNRMPM